MNIERLADELIASRCGTHSLGLVYEFLLRTYGQPKQARADFVRFLSGELPERMIEEAQLWVSEEQELEVPAPIDDDGVGIELAAESADDPSCVTQAPSKVFEPIQASW